MPQQVSLPINLSSTGWALVTQGYGGATSHSGALYYSLDFTYGGTSTYGTPVLAQVSGKVIALTESVPEGGAASTGLSDPSNGLSDIGNFVTVAGNNGVYQSAFHLKTNGVVPNIGDTVTAGQVLGYVGNTGYRSGPHIHTTLGLSTVTWKAGVIADGSASGGLPATFDTATGTIGAGVVAEISFNLSTKTLSAGMHNLYLMGSSNLSGTGDSVGNIISGNRGANTLDGLAGDDKIYGGSGNDTLIGGAGSDLMDGGAGLDTASYAGSSAGVSVNLSLSSSQNTGSATGYDTLISIENLTGSFYADVLIGNSSANRIAGGSGNDTISAGSGNDEVDGGAGIDVITGGLGKDTMSGGTGNDRFVFTSTSDSKVGSSYRDVIRDFQAGDLIDLSAIDANTLSSATGNQAFTFIGGSAFHKKAGEVRFSGGILSADTNGDGAPDFELQLLNFTTLAVGNLIA